MYSLWLDEIGGERQIGREKLDEYLNRPLDPAEAEEYDRENFGMTGEDLRDRLRSEAIFGGQ